MPEATKIVEFIELTSATVKAAQVELGRLQQQRQKIAADTTVLTTEAEKTADALITAGEYKPANRADVVTALQDHTKLLRFTAKLAAKRSAGAPTAVGQTVQSPDSIKTAGIIGARSSNRTASDDVFTKMMLGSNG